MQAFHQTYYDLLEIPTDASLEQIRHAYQKAKSLYSPDSQAMYSMFSEEEAKELLKILDEAYLTLSNPASKLEYDKSLNLSPVENVQRTQNNDIFSISGPSHNTPNKAPNSTKAGVGSTRFGEYEIKTEIEEEIKNETEFDGSFLKKVRTYKNISVELLSQHTKIGKHHIIAIEENNFSALPASVFVRGFVKQYADLVGLNSPAITDYYSKLCKQSRGE